jgi:pentatricopeptide repeat protein
VPSRNQSFATNTVRGDLSRPTNEPIQAELSDASDRARPFRIARLLSKDGIQPLPSTGDKYVRLSIRARRLASHTPKGFQRLAYIRLANYIACRSPQNEADLLNGWKDFLWQWGASEQRPHFDGIAAMDWTFLPQIDGGSFYNSSFDGQVTKHGPWRIRQAMPLLTTSSSDIFTCLVGTFCALSIESHDLDFFQSHGAFLYFAACMIYRVSLTTSRPLLEEKLEAFDLTSEQRRVFISALHNAHTHSTIVLACSKLNFSELTGTEVDAARVEALEDHYVAKLERLTIGVQALKLQTIWEDAHRTFRIYRTDWAGVNGSTRDLEHSKLTPKMYLSFMRVGYLLKRQSFAIEAWNEMTRLGVKPDIKHITTAIKGAGALRDQSQVESLWQMLVQSGLQTDDQAWSVRIGATMQSGDFAKGLALLQEMGNSWSQAAMMASKVNYDSASAALNTPKPTTRTLNVAIAALSNAKLIDFGCIQSLLKWATSLGIQSDTVTCNMIISMFVRSGKFKSALGILGQMESHHISPDVVTCTVLVSGLLTSQDISAISKHDRTDAVVRIIELMEKHSIVPNHRTLAVLLKGALDGSFDQQLSSSIIAFARSNGQKLYGSLATVLLEHILQSSSHDIQPILALWNHVNNADMQADAYFFNTMVQGFAKANQVNLMVAFLTRMIENGMPPTWHTLLSALSVSTQERDREVTTKIVAATEYASKASTLDDSRMERLFCDLAQAYGFREDKKAGS